MRRARSLDNGGETDEAKYEYRGAISGLRARVSDAVENDSQRLKRAKQHVQLLFEEMHRRGHDPDVRGYKPWQNIRYSPTAKTYEFAAHHEEVSTAFGEYATHASLLRHRASYKAATQSGKAPHVIRAALMNETLHLLRAWHYAEISSLSDMLEELGLALQWSGRVSMLIQVIRNKALATSLLKTKNSARDEWSRLIARARELKKETPSRSKSAIIARLSKFDSDGKRKPGDGGEFHYKVSTIMKNLQGIELS